MSLRRSGVVRTARLAQFLEPSSAEPWRSALPRQPGMLSEPGMRAAIKYWDSAQISADFKWAAWQASEAAVVKPIPSRSPTQFLFSLPAHADSIVGRFRKTHNIMHTAAGHA